MAKTPFNLFEMTPQPPLELVDHLRKLYNQYTGHEIAEAVKIIRRELTLQEEQEHLRLEQEKLDAKVIKFNAEREKIMGGREPRK